MKLQTILEEAGYETQSYSGRGMYGSRCLAFVTDDKLGDIIASVLDAYNTLEPEERDDAFDLSVEFRRMKSDSMGRSSSVYYFDGIPFEGEEPSDDDEEESEDAARYALTNPGRERFGGAS